jgi:hypothetical protein
MGKQHVECRYWAQDILETCKNVGDAGSTGIFTEFFGSFWGSADLQIVSDVERKGSFVRSVLSLS